MTAQENTTIEDQRFAPLYEVGQRLVFREYDFEEVQTLGEEHDYTFAAGDELEVVSRNGCGMGIDVMRLEDGKEDMVWPTEVLLHEDLRAHVLLAVRRLVHSFYVVCDTRWRDVAEDPECLGDGLCWDASNDFCLWFNGEGRVYGVKVAILPLHKAYIEAYYNPSDGGMEHLLGLSFQEDNFEGPVHQVVLLTMPQGEFIVDLTPRQFNEKLPVPYIYPYTGD